MSDHASIEEILETYQQCFVALDRHFTESDDPDASTFWGNHPVIMDDCLWAIDGNEIHFAYACDDPPESMEDFQQSYTVYKADMFKSVGGYSAICVDDGCGEQFWAVFKDSNRKTEWEP